MASKYQPPDCNWYDPLAKLGDDISSYRRFRPIAQSTIGVSEVIRFDAEKLIDGKYLTLNQLREMYLENPLRNEELAVVEVYIKRGYGGIPAKFAIKYRR